MLCFFFFKQKTAYEMRISDWSSDVCSSDLVRDREQRIQGSGRARLRRLCGALLPPAALSAPVLRRPVGSGCAVCLRPCRRCMAVGFRPPAAGHLPSAVFSLAQDRPPGRRELGRASCRERVCKYVSISVVSVSLT